MSFFRCIFVDELFFFFDCSALSKVSSYQFRVTGFDIDALRSDVGRRRAKRNRNRGGRRSRLFGLALSIRLARHRFFSFPTFDKALDEARVPHDDIVLVLARGLADGDHEVASHSVGGHFEREEREREGKRGRSFVCEERERQRRTEKKKSLPTTTEETLFFGVASLSLPFLSTLSLSPFGHGHPLAVAQDGALINTTATTREREKEEQVVVAF